MKVFHKKKISEQLIEAQQLAQKNGLEVDYIEITSKDWDRLKKELCISEICGGGKLKQFMGMEIKIVDEVIDDEELVEAVKVCRVGSVGINLHDIRTLIKRLCNGATYSNNVKEIPQKNRREFLDEVDKLLLASIKREAA